MDAKEHVELDGRWVTPGLIDCHTHLVYAGDRAHEFEMRLAGASYEEIARAGGGIVSTVQATRAASEDELVAQALPRLDALIAEGVTTIEIKSGYGLDLETEAQDAARRAAGSAREREVDVVTSFLGAHAMPPEATATRTPTSPKSARMIPRSRQEGLADAVDGFCEGIAFSPEQIARVFDAAKAHGLPVKLHADQLSNLHGAALAARYGALSADHLEYTDEAGVAAMARPARSPCCCRARSTSSARSSFRRSRRSAATASDGGRHRLQSRHLAAHVAAAGDEHGGDAVPADGRGVHRGRDAGGRARARPARRRSARSSPASRCDLAIWNIERPAELVYRHRIQPTARARLERQMTDAITISGDAAAAADWRATRTAAQRCD